MVDFVRDAIGSIIFSLPFKSSPFHPVPLFVFPGTAAGAGFQTFPVLDIPVVLTVPAVNRVIDCGGEDCH
jgi:hypothetical protein